MLKNILRERQKGAFMVAMALMLVIIVAFAALAIDVGRLLVLRTEMQNAVDAAALAAAKELDEQTGALARAEAAARQALEHNSYFASNQDLLPDDYLAHGTNIFFYNWIGSEYDPDEPPSTCPVDGVGDTNKCRTTNASDAHYVKVILDPTVTALNTTPYFKIELSFLPVLRVYDSGVTNTASAAAVAVAGQNSQLCNMPPLLICEPTAAPGEMILLKEHGNGAWEPGNFGFLIPPAMNWPDGTPIGNLQKELGAALAENNDVPCSPPYVDSFTGNKSFWPRIALNTRFGLYDKDFETYKYGYVPAPNVVAYPRDDEFYNDSDAKVGNQDWIQTEENGELLAHYGKADDVPTAGANYNDAYHGGTTVPGTVSRWIDYYAWELGADSSSTSWELDDYTLVNIPSFTIPGTVNAAAFNSNSSNDDCDHNDGWAQNELCRPWSGDPGVYTSTAAGRPSRRVLYVAMLNCTANPLNGHETDIYILEGGGKFGKFFLTEPVPFPGGTEKVNIYAEYLGEVIEERSELIHKVIQLYE